MYFSIEIWKAKLDAKAHCLISFKPVSFIAVPTFNGGKIHSLMCGKVAKAVKVCKSAKK